MALAARAGHSTARLGPAWLALTVALAAHVVDEALTDFLSVYNPLVSAARERWAWFPMPTFTFDVWLVGLIILVGVLLFAHAAGVPWRGACANGRVPLRRDHAAERRRASRWVCLPLALDARRDDCATPARDVSLAPAQQHQRRRALGHNGQAIVYLLHARDSSRVGRRGGRQDDPLWPRPFVGGAPRGRTRRLGGPCGGPTVSRSDRDCRPRELIRRLRRD